MHITQRVPRLRRTLTRVSTLAPNFTIPESYKKSVGHKIRDTIAKIGSWIEPLKKYIFPNFIAVHYIYIISMTILTSILLYPVKNAKYIDILFLATGASTQGGLNTIDVNSLTLYQQIIIYITCCLTTPIAIHGFLAFVRLYWFERYFDGINDFSKKDFKMRRTKTILQREMTRRSMTIPRQYSMRFARSNQYNDPYLNSDNDGQYRDNNGDRGSYEMQNGPKVTFSQSGHNHSTTDMNNNSNGSLVSPHSQSDQMKRNLSSHNHDTTTITSSDTTKRDYSKESSVDITSNNNKNDSNANTASLSGPTNTPDITTKREPSSSKDFQEKLFSGQLVNRDEEGISEEQDDNNISQGRRHSNSRSRSRSRSRTRSSTPSNSERALQRSKSPIMVDNITEEPRNSESYGVDSKRPSLDRRSVRDLTKSASAISIESERERFAKRRQSTEITPQDMLRSLQMLRDQHEETEENDGPALVIQGPNEKKSQKLVQKNKLKPSSQIQGSTGEMSRLSVNTLHKRSESNGSVRRTVTPHNIQMHPQGRTSSALDLMNDASSRRSRANSVDNHSPSILSTDYNDSINSGDAADINDDNTSNESDNSNQIGDSFAVSDNSETDSDADSQMESEISELSPSGQSPRHSINSKLQDDGNFSSVKTQSTTELDAQHHQDIRDKIAMHPIGGSFEGKPTVTFGPEPPQHRQTIQFDIQQPPRKHLVKMESSQEIPTWSPKRPPYKRAPSTSKYLMKQFRKGKKFRKNLKRRLSTNSIENDLKGSETTKEHGSSKTSSHDTNQPQVIDEYFADDETDEENGSPISAKPTLQNVLSHSMTFSTNDKSKLNELAQELSFQKMIYKQWKREHRNKRHLRSPRKIGARYITKRRKNNVDGLHDIERFRTQHNKPNQDSQLIFDDSAKSFNSVSSLPDTNQSGNGMKSTSGLPHLLYESSNNSNRQNDNIYRQTSHYTTDDGYDNDADDDNLDDDNDSDSDTENRRDEEDNESGQSYYGFHPDDDLGPSFADQIHPLSKTMSSNYLSWQPTVSRNSNFTGLTNIQKNELGGVEYRAIKLLCRILIIYYVGFHIMCFVMMLPWICRDAKYAHIVREAGVSPAWWGFWTAMSSFNDLGLTLTPDSMNSFNTAVYPLVVMIWFIIIGNTGFPILLRWIIWVIFKLSPDLSHIRESTGFLLDHPRRCFTLLFPESATWWLLLTLLGLNLTDFILFIILDLGSTVLKPISRGYRVLNGLFQAVSTRTAGFGVVDLSQLNAATQVSYMLMMYVSVLPLAISIRRTNVYEEQSLGLYGEVKSESEEEDEEEEGENEDEDEDDNVYNSDDGDHIGSHSNNGTLEGSSRSNKSSTSSSASDKKKKKKRKHRKSKSRHGEPEDANVSTRSFIGQHLRKQLSFDLWFVFLGLFVICICENDKIKDSTMPNFNVFSILFEVVSAYGTVGLSLGYPSTNQSFSSRFTTLSKLVIIGMLIRGRNRGLPYSLDRAIILPSERLEHIDHIEDLKLKRRKDHDENVDPLTGLFRKSMKRFTRKVEETPIYRTFTQDFSHEGPSGSHPMYQHNNVSRSPHQQRFPHRPNQRYQPQPNDYFTEEDENEEQPVNSYESSSIRPQSTHSDNYPESNNKITGESLRDRQQRINEAIV